ncbi:DUF1697 domain-containing protein [Variovorax sp. J31P179]|uniref:DUF1697 domain-containing protein n=1 Tax=Variovorax sp. J31P179 TaxID=3053508 RepID=UPI0025779993|nr:DUF1697 domain-containing protein [Variovorax sp. J31P179]MDM0080301.1 DUF1697 domain-containing protein [Variovorax sp. J31P179]
MPRYVAFLRGVSPMNAKMPELKRCFESAGFTEVKTLLSSGNVAFDARAAARTTLERKAEAAMEAALGRRFLTIVRSSDALRDLLAADPCAPHELPAGAKRVVTFLREPRATRLALPIEFEAARILAMDEMQVFSAYVPGPRGPVFMTLIEKTFGTELTTRTWETVKKCAAA